jgi:translation initiation factor IF-1
MKSETAKPTPTSPKPTPTGPKPSRDPKGAALEATVVESLPHGVVRVKLENEHLVLAHPAGAAKLNFVRVRPGDRVQVEIAPHDASRGRIVRLLNGRRLDRPAGDNE